MKVPVAMKELCKRSSVRFPSLSKMAIEAIYLRLGVLPLRYQLMKKKIMYFWDIIDRDDEITKKSSNSSKEGL